MIIWKKGVIKRILVDRDNLQEAEVTFSTEKTTGRGLARAVNFPSLSGRIEDGDHVLLNTTAVDLQLGSGGKHFVSSNLSSPNTDRLKPDEINGHMMKMRYTPMQTAVQTCEEQTSPFHNLFCQELNIKPMPVLLCELHSMVPILVSALKTMQPRIRITYMMTDGGALPLSFSQHVQELMDKEWLEGTITCGHSFGGDVETINEYTGLLAAKHLLHADVTVAAMGPGHAGTGTIYGFSGIEQGEMVNRVSILEGVPIFVPRISFRDVRSRHYGISHHSITSLVQIALRRAIVPVPRFGGERDGILDEQLKPIIGKHDVTHRLVWTEGRIKKMLSSYPKEIQTMGRGVGEDPEFFQNCIVSAESAVQVLRNLSLQTGMPYDPEDLLP